jgi:hypothetical protein
VEHRGEGGVVTRTEAAKYLGVSVGTLANWAAMGVGPRFCKRGRKTDYRKLDLDAFLGGGTCPTCGQSIPMRMRRPE